MPDPIATLADRIRARGLDPDAARVDMVRWMDDYFQTIDQRRVAAAQAAGLRSVPSSVHAPGEPRREEDALRWILEDELDDATLTELADLVDRPLRPGEPATRWGEAAAFRAANQRTRPGSEEFPLFGTVSPPRARDAE